LIGVSGVIVPLSRPAAAVTTLKVEPGGYWPCVTRLSRGVVGSVFSCERCSGTRFGSYGGLEANTLTRPVFGSIATTAPKPTALSSSMASFCAAGSIEVTMSLPCFVPPWSWSRIDLNSDSAPISSPLWYFSNSESPCVTKL
jgi:hypothetical protein